MEKIVVKPIGIIHSPYKKPDEVPIQGKFGGDVEAWIELDDQYASGLTDLDQFSHAIILYFFHQSKKENLLGKPYLENKSHGIFAIRGPNRPNHIGLSVVKIKQIKGSKLYFSEVDVVDGTPVLDIKPYIRYYDCREDAVSGWLEKHFSDGNIPAKTRPKEYTGGNSD
jgi:tRNA-Thr(GGU) m(6)t(6)A37 methyltransferase TsaA